MQRWVRMGGVLVTLAFVLALTLVPRVAFSRTSDDVRVTDLHVEQSKGPDGVASIVVKFRDPDLRILSVSAALVSPDGLDRVPLTFAQTRSAGFWRSDIQLPPGMVAGDWTVRDLQATDDTGVQSSFNDTAILKIAAETTVAHTGSVLRIPDKQYRETQIIPVWVSLPAEKSTAMVTVRVVGPKGRSVEQNWPLAAPQTGGEVEVPVRLVKGMGAGEWRIARLFLQLTDGALLQYVAGTDFDGRFHVVKGREDTTPPTIDSIVLSDGAVTTGQSLGISVRASDDLAGVNAVLATLVDSTGQFGTEVSLTHTEQGDWTGSLNIVLYAPSGDWHVQVRAFDGVGNETTAPATRTFSVSAGFADAPQPVLERAQLAVLPGALTATVGLAGDVPATQVWVTLTGPGNVEPMQLPLDEGSQGNWSRVLPLSLYAPSGAWRMTEIEITDATGRTHTVKSLADSQPATVAEYDNPSSDSEPPLLDGVVVSASVSPGDRLHVAVTAHDGQAGIESATARFSGPGDAQLIVPLHQDEAGHWVGTALVPPAAATGTWYLTAVHLRDEAFNGTDATPAQPVSFVVQ